jgi:hypothetical protein
MKISTTHQKFANDLKDQTALEYPEYFIGPNWKDVLNFWIYLDTLSGEKRKIISNRFDNLEELGRLTSITLKAAEDTIGVKYVDAAWSAPPSFASAYATCELINSHNLESFNFLPLFLNP